MNKDEVPLLLDEEGSTNEDVPQRPHESTHRYVSLCHMVFRCAPLIAYMFCGLFSDSFIGNFVWLILLLSLDFWFLKNISGRFMVGLRWWNYVDDKGDSHWIYESRNPEQNMKNDPNDVRLFWTALFAVPAIWAFFFFVALISFNFRWLSLMCIALSLNFANLYGYLKCRFGNTSITSSISSSAKSFAKRMVIENISSILTKQEEGQDAKKSGTMSV